MRSWMTQAGLAAITMICGCVAQSTTTQPSTLPAAKAWPVTQPRGGSERTLDVVRQYARDVDDASTPKVVAATAPADLDPDSVANAARELELARQRKTPVAAPPAAIAEPPMRSSTRDDIERLQMQAQIDEQRDENKRLNDRIEKLILRLETLNQPATAPAPAPLVAVAVPATMPVDRAMRDVLSNLGNTAVKTPRDPLRQLDLQIAKFLGEQSVPDASDLAALAQDDQEVISALVDALVNYRQLMRSEPNALPRQKVRLIFDIAARLRGRADLALPTFMLVGEVKQFGMYTPVEPKFKAGVETGTAFYCEVENFRPERTQAEKWETRLVVSLELFNERGLSVWTSPRWQKQDVNARERRDFFVADKFTIPARLVAGRYSLKMTVKDLVTNRVAEKSIDLTLIQ